MKYAIPIPRIMIPLRDKLILTQPPNTISDTVLTWDKWTVVGSFHQDDMFVYTFYGFEHSYSLHRFYSRIEIIDTHGRPFEKTDGYYRVPDEFTGNGQPVVASFQGVRLYEENDRPSHVVIELATFWWMDSPTSEKGFGGVENHCNRSDGPKSYILSYLELTKDSMSWETRNPATKMIDYMNPFRIPFFDDPQDELAYKTVT